MEAYHHILSTFYTQHKRMPSYREMLGLFGFKSKNAVAGVIAKLIENNILAKDGRHIIPGERFHRIHILGTIQAGFPTPAEEDRSATMTLDEWLIDNKESTYMLTVSGDSMKDAGILPGDVVLVERTTNPSVGSIVIAEIDGEWTMKYLRKKGSTYYLQAANDTYDDLYPDEDLSIPAVVRAVIRKY